MKARSVLLAALCLTLSTPLMALPAAPEIPAAPAASTNLSDAVFLATFSEPMPCEEVCCFPTAPPSTLCYIGPEVKSCSYFWQVATCEIG